MAFSGCSSQNKTDIKQEDTTEYAFSIGETDVSKEEFNIYLYETQKSFEQLGGTDIWETDFDGRTAESVAIDNTLNSIQLVKFAVEEAEKRGVTLDDSMKNQAEERAEEMYDGLYTVCTDLLDDDVADILKVSEGRWQIEDCFRTMKTDFEARPVYLNREDRIKAHFLTCFLALLHFRLLNRSLKGTYTTEQLLHTLKDIKFADVEEQGFMPVYERQEITDDLHETCGFRTDYQFITKRKMKGIQKKSKRR